MRRLAMRCTRLRRRGLLPPLLPSLPTSPMLLPTTTPLLLSAPTSTHATVWVGLVEPVTSTMGAVACVRGAGGGNGGNGAAWAVPG